MLTRLFGSYPLEEDGYVCRKVYAEVPPKVEYCLTERAISLIPIINELIVWAQENMAEIINGRKKEKCHSNK